MCLGQDHSNQSRSTEQEFDVHKTWADWVRTLFIIYIC